MTEPGEDAQPPQGGDLGQQRLRLQSVRRSRGSRTDGRDRRLGRQTRERSVRSAASRQSEQPGPQFADADLARELAELTRAANRANATLYTIDPRGLVAGSDIDENVDSEEWNAYVRKTQDSLRVLAEQTGGIRGRQPERFRQGAEADRRRDERLLRARLSTRAIPIR